MSRWDAQRRGEIYCAPACGGNCTWKAYQTATARATALCARLGPGWKPHVWENLGWHYAAISPCKRLKVKPPVHGTYYYAFLGEPDGSISGSCEDGPTPEAAVRNTIAAGRADLERTRKLVAGFESVLANLKDKGHVKPRLYRGKPSPRRSSKG